MNASYTLTNGSNSDFLDSTDVIVSTVIHLLYFVLCSWLIIGCMTLLLPICYYKALRSRKNYVLTGALLFAGLMLAVSNWLMALDRLIPLIRGQINRLHPVPSCWWLAYHRMLMLSASSPFVLVVVSVDRLLLVMRPMWHTKQTAVYIYRMLVPICAHAFCLSALAFVMRPQDTSVRTVRLCLWKHIDHPAVRAYASACSALGAFGSVLVFSVTWCCYYRKMKAKVVEGSQTLRSLEQQQRRFTRAFTRSTLCNLCLVIIPVGLVNGFVLNRMQPCSWNCAAVGQACYIIALCNVGADVLIFGRQPELRIAIKAFATLKVMPLDTDLWNYS